MQHFVKKVFALIAVVMFGLSLSTANAAYFEFDRPSGACPFYMPTSPLNPCWMMVPVRLIRQGTDVAEISIRPGSPWAGGTWAPGQVKVQYIDAAGVIQDAQNNLHYNLMQGPAVAIPENENTAKGYFYIRLLPGDANAPTWENTLILSFPGNSAACSMRTTPMFEPWAGAGAVPGGGIVTISWINVLNTSTTPVQGYVTISDQVVTFGLFMENMLLTLNNGRMDLGLAEDQVAGGTSNFTIESNFPSNPGRNLEQTPLPTLVSLANQLVYYQYPIFANSFYTYTVTPTGKANDGDILPITFVQQNLGNINIYAPGDCALVPDAGAGIRFTSRFISFTGNSVREVKEGELVACPFVLTNTAPFPYDVDLYFGQTSTTVVANEDYLACTDPNGNPCVSNVGTVNGSVRLAAGQTSGVLYIQTMRSPVFTPNNEDGSSRKSISIGDHLTPSMVAVRAYKIGENTPIDIAFGYRVGVDGNEYAKNQVLQVMPSGGWPYVSFTNTTEFVPVANDGVAELDIVANRANSVFDMSVDFVSNTPYSYHTKRATSTIPIGQTVPNPLTSINLFTQLGYTQYVTFTMRNPQKCVMGPKFFCTYELEPNQTVLTLAGSDAVGCAPGGSAKLTVTVKYPQNVPIRIPLSYAPTGANPATNGVDFVGPPELVIPAFATSATLVIPAALQPQTTERQAEIIFANPLTANCTWLGGTAPTAVLTIQMANPTLPEGILLPSSVVAVPPEIGQTTAVGFKGGSTGDITVSSTPYQSNYVAFFSTDGTTWQKTITLPGVGTTFVPFFFKATNGSTNYSGNGKMTITYTSGNISKNMTVNILDNRTRANFIARAFAMDVNEQITINPLTASPGANAVASEAGITDYYAPTPITSYTAENISGDLTAGIPIVPTATDIGIGPLGTPLTDTQAGSFDFAYGISNTSGAISVGAAHITIGSVDAQTYPNALIPYTKQAGSFSYIARYYNPFSTAATAAAARRSIILSTTQANGVNYLKLSPSPLLYNPLQLSNIRWAGLYSDDPSLQIISPLAIEIYAHNNSTGAETLLNTCLLSRPNVTLDANGNVVSSLTNVSSWSDVIPVALPKIQSTLAVHPGSILSVTGDFLGKTPSAWLECANGGASSPLSAACKILSVTGPAPNSNTSTVLIQLPTQFPQNWVFEQNDAFEATGVVELCISSGVAIAGGQLLLKKLIPTAPETYSPTTTTNTQDVILTMSSAANYVDIPMSLMQTDNTFAPAFQNIFLNSDINGDPLNVKITNIAYNTAMASAPFASSIQVVTNAAGGKSIRITRSPKYATGGQVTISYSVTKANATSAIAPVTGQFVIAAEDKANP